MKKSFTVAKFLVIALSIAAAIVLWLGMRPSFIHDDGAHGYCCQDEVCSHPTQEQPAPQPEASTPDQSKPCCAALEQTQPCCAHLEEKKTPLTTNKPSKKPAPGAKTLAEIQPPAEKPALVPGKVLVTNGIEKKMLGYKKFGTHYPTTFKVSVGKATVPQGGSCAATPINNSLLIRYDFEFMNGYRHGAKEVTFTLKPGTEAITLTFDWKNEHHLLADADKVVSITEKDVPYQK